MTSLKNHSVVPFLWKTRDIEMTDGKSLAHTKEELDKYCSGEKDLTILVIDQNFTIIDMTEQRRI